MQVCRLKRPLNCTVKSGGGHVADEKHSRLPISFVRVLLTCLFHINIIEKYCSIRKKCCKKKKQVTIRAKRGEKAKLFQESTSVIEAEQLRSFANLSAKFYSAFSSQTFARSDARDLTSSTRFLYLPQVVPPPGTVTSSHTRSLSARRRTLECTSSPGLTVHPATGSGATSPRRIGSFRRSCGSDDRPPLPSFCRRRPSWQEFDIQATSG